MESVAIELKAPISQFVEQQSRDRRVSRQDAVVELVSLGFETLFRQSYERYRRGEMSYGRLAQQMGVTTWELSHLLEERDWPAYNLPS
jgi:stalled ribosome alternative rescue factor ArfA